MIIWQKYFFLFFFFYCIFLLLFPFKKYSYNVKNSIIKASVRKILLLRNVRLPKGIFVGNKKWRGRGGGVWCLILLWEREGECHFWKASPRFRLWRGRDVFGKGQSANAQTLRPTGSIWGRVGAPGFWEGLSGAKG